MRLEVYKLQTILGLDLTRKTYLKFLADSEFSVHSLFLISDSNSFFFLDGSYSITVYINSTKMMVLFKFAVRN